MRRILAGLLALLTLLCLSCALAQEEVLVIRKWKTQEELYKKIEAAGTPAHIDLSPQAMSQGALDKVMARYPASTFDYQLRIGKRRVKSDSAEVDIGYHELDGGMDELLALLEYFPRATSVTALGTAFTAEDMAKFTEAHPGVNYLFKLRFAHYTVRTDITAFCTKHALYYEDRHTEEDFAALKYCRDLKALDFGHNAVASLEFLRELPKLQILICVDNRLTDITPLESQSELEYIELFLNPGITDISVLAGLDKLYDLHISHCGITDISPLYGLKNLDRLWLAQNPIPQEQLQHIRELMPNCTINTTVDTHPTAEGWRQGHPRYLKIRKMFEENRYVQFP